MNNHYTYMSRAIELAKCGHYTTSPNPRVGCVLVKDGQVIGEGFHQKAGQAHAEVNAIADAKANGFDICGATAYVTLEPCSHYGRTPPCSEALIEEKVAHVVIAMEDPFPQVSGRGIRMLNDAGITTEVGILAQEAQALNIGFLHLVNTGKPYVRCKLAASLDGKTAMANGESQWITSSQSRADVQRLRAQSCAIISGADSVMMDNARLNVRVEQLSDALALQYSTDIRQPIRVIIDSQNRITPDLALFTSDSPVILATTQTYSEQQFPSFVEQLIVNQDSNTGKLDLNDLLHKLGERGLNDILLESGARLAGAFIERKLVDELILYQAPKLMGHQGQSLINLENVFALKEAIPLEINDVRLLGNDIRITSAIK